MKKYQNFKLLKYWLGTVFLAASLIFISCSEDTNPSIYEDLPKGDTPTISTLSPADSGLAGITEITINGNNFSPDISKNIVYFNGEIGTILSASANQLVVKAPKLVNDSVAIKIAVRGVELFSDAYMFSLKSALKQIYDFKDFEFPYAITVDNSNNVYFNFVVSGLSTGLSSINPAGLIETFSPKGGESFYTDLKYAGNGKIYGTRFPPVRAIFGSVAGESPKAVAMAEQTAKLLTLDLDNNKNIWAAGSGGNIYRITPDEADKKAFPFDFSIGSLRFFDGYLYALVNLEATQSIYRFKVVNSDSLGQVKSIIK
ncbi:MAG: IPT/TIG domain-containing protein [Ignavibacteriales bacterium]|nr:IPT/TIG domain-containing protein [Ignavibacteriales bacterium]